MKILMAFAFAAALLAAPVNAATYSGSNNPGDGSWNRPVLNGPGISSLGPVNYSVQTFFVGTTGLYNIASVQDYDGYLHLYIDSFDPVDQLTNLLAGNDDGVGSIGTSNIDGQNLSIGSAYFLVTSAFAAGDVGSFRNEITGVGDVTLSAVPLPAGAILLLTAIGGLTMTRRRRK